MTDLDALEGRLDALEDALSALRAGRPYWLMSKAGNPHDWSSAPEPTAPSADAMERARQEARLSIPTEILGHPMYEWDRVLLLCDEHDFDLSELPRRFRVQRDLIRSSQPTQQRKLAMLVRAVKAHLAQLKSDECLQVVNTMSLRAALKEAKE